MNWKRLRKNLRRHWLLTILGIGVLLSPAGLVIGMFVAYGRDLLPPTVTAGLTTLAGAYYFSTKEDEFLVVFFAGIEMLATVLVLFLLHGF